MRETETGSRPIKFTSLKHNYIGEHTHSIYYSLPDVWMCHFQCLILLLHIYDGLRKFLFLPHLRFLTSYVHKNIGQCNVKLGHFENCQVSVLNAAFIHH